LGGLYGEIRVGGFFFSTSLSLSFSFTFP